MDAPTPSGLIGLPGPDAAEKVRAAGLLPRLLQPGDIVTMEFRGDRVNLHLDEGDTVVDVSRG